MQNQDRSEKLLAGIGPEAARGMHVRLSNPRQMDGVTLEAGDTYLQTPDTYHNARVSKVPSAKTGADRQNPYNLIGGPCESVLLEAHIIVNGILRSTV
jgi:hypothetical protein